MPAKLAALSGWREPVSGELSTEAGSSGKVRVVLQVDDSGEAYAAALAEYNAEPGRTRWVQARMDEYGLLEMRTVAGADVVVSGSDISARLVGHGKWWFLDGDDLAYRYYLADGRDGVAMAELVGGVEDQLGITFGKVAVQACEAATSSPNDVSVEGLAMSLDATFLEQFAWARTAADRPSLVTGSLVDMAIGTDGKPVYRLEDGSFASSTNGGSTAKRIVFSLTDPVLGSVAVTVAPTESASQVWVSLSGEQSATFSVDIGILGVNPSARAIQEFLAAEVGTRQLMAQDATTLTAQIAELSAAQIDTLAQYRRLTPEMVQKIGSTVRDQLALSTQQQIAAQEASVSATAVKQAVSRSMIEQAGRIQASRQWVTQTLGQLETQAPGALKTFLGGKNLQSIEKLSSGDVAVHFSDVLTHETGQKTFGASDPLYALFDGLRSRQEESSTTLAENYRALKQEASESTLVTDGIGALFTLAMSAKTIFDAVSMSDSERAQLNGLALAQLDVGLAQAGIGLAQLGASAGASIALKAATLAVGESAETLLAAAQTVSSGARALGGVGVGLQWVSVGLDITKLSNATNWVDRSNATLGLVTDTALAAVGTAAVAADIGAILGFEAATAAVPGINLVALAAGMVAIPVTYAVSKSNEDFAKADDVATYFGNLNRAYNSAEPLDGIGKTGLLNLFSDSGYFNTDAQGNTTLAHPSSYDLMDANGKVVNASLAAVDTIDLSQGTYAYAANYVRTSRVQQVDGTHPVGTSGYYKASAESYNFSEVLPWSKPVEMQWGAGSDINLAPLLSENSSGTTRYFDASLVNSVLLPVAPQSHLYLNVAGQTAGERVNGVLKGSLTWGTVSDSDFGVAAIKQKLEPHGVAFDVAPSGLTELGAHYVVDHLDRTYNDTTVQVKLGNKAVPLVTPTDIPTDWLGKITYDIQGNGGDYNVIHLGGNEKYQVRAVAHVGEVWALTGTGKTPPIARRDASGNLEVTADGCTITFLNGPLGLPKVSYRSQPSNSDGTITAYSDIETVAIPTVATFVVGQSDEVVPLAYCLLGNAYGRSVLLDTHNNILDLEPVSQNGALSPPRLPSGKIQEVVSASIGSGGTLYVTLKNGLVFMERPDPTSTVLQFDLVGVNLETYKAYWNLGGTAAQVLADAVKRVKAGNTIQATVSIVGEVGSALTVNNGGNLLYFLPGASAGGQFAYADAAGHVFTPLGSFQGVSYFFNAEVKEVVGAIWSESAGIWQVSNQQANISAAAVVSDALYVERDDGCKFLKTALNGATAWHLLSVDLNVFGKSALAQQVGAAPQTAQAAQVWIHNFLSLVRGPDGASLGVANLIGGNFSLRGRQLPSGSAMYNLNADGSLSNLVFADTPNGMVLVGIDDTQVRDSAHLSLSQAGYVATQVAQQPLHADFIVLNRAVNDTTGAVVTGWYDTLAKQLVVPSFHAEASDLDYAGFDTGSDAAVLFSVSQSQIYLLDPSTGGKIGTFDIDFDLSGLKCINNVLVAESDEGLQMTSVIGSDFSLGDWVLSGVSSTWLQYEESLASAQTALAKLVTASKADGMAVAPVLNVTGEQFGQQALPGPISARYIMLRKDDAVSGQLSMEKLAVWADGENLLGGLPASAYRYAGGTTFDGRGLFDGYGVAGGPYTSAASSDARWVQIDLGEVRTIDRISLSGLAGVASDSSAHAAIFTSENDMSGRTYADLASAGDVHGEQWDSSGPSSAGELVYGPTSWVYDVAAGALLVPHGAQGPGTALPADAHFLGYDSTAGAGYWFSAAAGTLYRGARAAAGDPLAAISTIGACADARIVGGCLSLLLKGTSPLSVLPALDGVTSLLLGNVDSSIGAATTELQLQTALDHYTQVVFSAPQTIPLPSEWMSLFTLGNQQQNLVETRRSDQHQIVLRNAIDSTYGMVGSGWQFAASVGGGTVIWNLRSMQTQGQLVLGAVAASRPSLSSSDLVTVNGAAYSSLTMPVIRVGLDSTARVYAKILTIYDGNLTAVVQHTLSDAERQAGYADMILGRALADGEHTLTAVLSDGAASASLASAALTFTVDAHVPSVRTSIDNNGKQVSSSGNSTQFTVSGGLSAALTSGDRLEVSLDGGATWLRSDQAGSGVSVDGTDWQVTGNASASSSLSVQARVVSRAGRYGSTAHEAVSLSARENYANIDQMSKDTGDADFITRDGSAGRTVSGTLATALRAGDSVEVSVDDGLTWHSSLNGAVTVAGTAWSVTDGGTHTGNWSIRTRLRDANGVLGTSTMSEGVILRTEAPTTTTTIAYMSHDSGGNDFITSDGSPNRIVAGTLSTRLTNDQFLEVSFDDGQTWKRSDTAADQVSVGGLGWMAIDPNAHAASWSVRARVVDGAGNAGQTAVQAVSLTADAPTVRLTPAIVSMDPQTGSGSFAQKDIDVVRTVYGTLNGVLGQNEYLEVSFDGGKTWQASNQEGDGVTVANLQWQAVDDGLHASDWVIQARVVLNGITGNAVSQQVTLDAAPPIEQASLDTTLTSRDTGVVASVSTVDITGKGTQVGLSGATARYVRIYHSDGGSYLTLLGLEAWSGGLNVAAGKAATAGQDGGGADTSVFNPAALTDSNVGPAWNGQIGAASNLAWVHSTNGSPAYLELDLGQAYPLSSLVLYGRADYPQESQNLQVFTSTTPFGTATYDSLSAGGSALAGVRESTTLEQVVADSGYIWRTVSGSLSAVLAEGERLHVSLDGGQTWLTTGSAATVSTVSTTGVGTRVALSGLGTGEVTARYVRIYHSDGGSYLTLLGLEAWSGGLNVAAGKGATAGQDGGGADTSVFNPAALTDSNVGPAWNGQIGAASNLAWVHSTNGSPAYLELDLGQAYQLSSLVLYGRADYPQESQNLQVFTSMTPFGTATYASLSEQSEGSGLIIGADHSWQATGQVADTALKNILVAVTDAAGNARVNAYGDNVLVLGGDNDVIQCNTGATTVVWTNNGANVGGDHGVILGFDAAQGDRLDLAAWLPSDYVPGDPIDNWVDLETGLSDAAHFGGAKYSRLCIDANGNGDFTSPSQVILFDHDALAGFASAQAMEDGGALVSYAPRLTQSLPDQVALPQESYAFALPSNLFAEVVDGEALTNGDFAWSVEQSDGSALPSWLTFDAATLTLSGTPPAGTQHLNLVVTATDDVGQATRTAWQLHVAPVASLTPQQFQRLSTSQLINMTATDWAAVTAAQVGSISADGLRALLRGAAGDLTAWLRTNRPGQLTASASSNVAGGDLARVIDGNVGVWSWNHTDSGPNEWLKVDLGAAYTVTRIEIDNRVEACGERLNGASVQLLDASENVLANLGTISGAYNGSVHTLNVPDGLLGNVASVRLVQHNTNLHVAEVKVFGYPVVGQTGLRSDQMQGMTAAQLNQFAQDEFQALSVTGISSSARAGLDATHAGWLTAVLNAAGFAGTSKVYGSAGDDELYGGAGDAVISGGAGTDTADYCRSEVSAREQESRGVDVNLSQGQANVRYRAGHEATVLRTLRSGDGIAMPDYKAIPVGQLVTGSRYQAGTTGLVFQGDGNLVIYNALGQALWDSGTWNHPGATCWVQGDGNLVIYDSSGSSIWHSNTSGHPGAELRLGSDGSLVMMSATAATTERLISIENVVGTAQADRLIGNDQANILYGGAGGDELDGGSGTDTLMGGAGNDLLHSDAQGGDRLDGGEGVNTVSYVGSTQGVEVNLVQHYGRQRSLYTTAKNFALEQGDATLMTPKFGFIWGIIVGVVGNWINQLFNQGTSSGSASSSGGGSSSSAGKPPTPVSLAPLSIVGAEEPAAGAPTLLVIPGDFNGDGKTDLLKVWNFFGCMRAMVHLSTGTGFEAQDFAIDQGGMWSSQKWLVGDFNGDGKTDLMKFWNDNGMMTADVHVSTGSAFAMQRWATGQGGITDGMNWQLGDFNGDGKIDLMKIWNDNGLMTADVHLSTGSGFTMQRWATGQGAMWNGMNWQLGDFNGDGKTDMMKFWNDNGQMTVDVHLSTGSGFAMQRWATGQGAMWDGMNWQLGDFNGDGKTDLMKFWNDNGSLTADVHLSSGSGFVMQRWATRQTMMLDSDNWRQGDFNGDGKTDLMRVLNGGAAADVLLSTGSGFTSTRLMTRAGGANTAEQWTIGDFDGNGKDDLLGYQLNGAALSADAYLTAGVSTDTPLDQLLGIENIVGSDHEDNLTGDAGANQITGGAGDDILEGWMGNDTYVHGLGDGQDTISDADSTLENTDILQFTDINQTNLWLSHVGNDLQISVLGSSDLVTVKNWYLGGTTGSDYQIERIKTADGLMMYNTDVERLVQAMAAATPPAATQTSWSSGQIVNGEMLIAVTH